MHKKKVWLLLSFPVLLFSCAPSSTTEPSTSSPSSEPTSSTTTEEPIITVTNDPTSSPTTEVKSQYELTEGYVVYQTIDYSEVDEVEDPYLNIDVDEFYDNYSISSSYVDSYYRSLHGLLCGELIDENGEIKQHKDAPKDEEGYYYKNAVARFGINEDGERISYTINTLDGNDYTIYRGGMYISMNDVCAYLFAFNELPKNYIAGTSLRSEAYERYGEIGRLNFNKYTGPSATRYQYEPYLMGQEDKSLYYREIDFGANVGSDHYYTYQDTYGSDNGRGPFRILLANSYDSSYTYSKKSETYSTPNPTEIDDRYVYYTYNHYNDFVEYLNYYDGFADPFGNCTAGNEENEYVPSNPPTPQTPSKLAIFNY